MLLKSTLNNLDFLQHIFQLASFNDKMQCFGSGFFSQIQISLFSDSGSCSRSAKNPDPIRKNPDPIRKNPDPDLWKLEFKYSRRKYYISYLALLLSFLVRLLQNLIKSSKPSFRSYKFINGRIRTFKTWIRIDKKPGSIRIRLQIRTLIKWHIYEIITGRYRVPVRYILFSDTGIIYIILLKNS